MIILHISTLQGKAGLPGAQGPAGPKGSKVEIFSNNILFYVT